jgi:predicted secreted protein
METITLKPGQEHRFSLPGLGSAGYQWMVESCDQRVAVVEEILHSKQEVTVPIVGSLNQEFRLTAIAAGHTSVRLVQRRRFEKSGTPHATYEMDVIVDG